MAIQSKAKNYTTMAKRENDSFSIEDLMQLFIKENKLTKGMQKIKIEETWHKMMGQGVTVHTTSVKLQNKTLVIQLNSSVLREELSYGKDKIIKMMNEEIGEEIISKLMLI
jgi:predicted nucleic acid-binding Zn ribbon protein